MVSKKKKKKKKKKVFTEFESDFSAEIVRLRLVGGDASPNGAELFQIEADFSAEIVTFRLVGGMHSPHPPPKSATEARSQKFAMGGGLFWGSGGGAPTARKLRIFFAKIT